MTPRGVATAAGFSLAVVVSVLSRLLEPSLNGLMYFAAVTANRLGPENKPSPCMQVALTLP